MIEQFRYTTELVLTYYFDKQGLRRAEPNLNVRIYHDARLAEVMSAELRRWPGFNAEQHTALRARWHVNRFLYKWAELIASIRAIISHPLTDSTPCGYLCIWTMPRPHLLIQRSLALWHSVLTLDGYFANPGSNTHRYGAEAREQGTPSTQPGGCVDSRRWRVKSSGPRVQPRANNLALKSAALQYRRKGRHIITCKT